MSLAKHGRVHVQFHKKICILNSLVLDIFISYKIRDAVVTFLQFPLFLVPYLRDSCRFDL